MQYSSAINDYLIVGWSIGIYVFILTIVSEVNGQSSLSHHFSSTESPNSNIL